MINDEQTRIVGGTSSAGTTPFFAPQEATAPFPSLEVATAASAGVTQHGKLGPGDVLANRFVLEECLGVGGMGVVWKAKDLFRERAQEKEIHVALKVLSPELAANEQQFITGQKGLQREGTRSLALSHHNIIRVHDFYWDEDRVFMSMEYLRGRTLNGVIRDIAYRGGMALKEAWPIILGMGQALVFAHEHNIVHSDFKPGNVFLTDHNEVKVLDFGIAAKFDPVGNPDATLFDARGEVGYTPPYASFEMMNGAKADPRDDVYAFGLVVYELLTGSHPYDRKSASDVFLEQQRTGRKVTPKPVPGLSRKQWHLLKSAMELMQEHRPKRLDEWLNEFDPAAKWSSTVVGVVGVGVFSILVLAGVWWNLGQDQSGETMPRAESAAAVTTKSQSNEAVQLFPPIADPGLNQQAVVGSPIKLSAASSRSSDGSPLVYSWRLKELPPESRATLSNPASISPEFTADKPGVYVAELTVTDSRNHKSAPGTVQIEVAIPAIPEPSHVGVSQDGVLQLEAEKPAYKIGEELRLKIKVSRSGYLRVAYISSKGEITNLLPNDFQSGKVKAGAEYKIPPKRNSFVLKVTGPAGVDGVVALFREGYFPKVTNILNTDGSIASYLIKPDIYIAKINYRVE